MPKPPLFKCLHCGARYHVVQIEADASADVEINCLICDQPLRFRDGPFILKYFLTNRPQPRTRQPIVQPVAL